MKLDPSRTRRPNARFGWGWVDRRLLLDGHLIPMSQAEVVVYFFLCVVADRHGVSWYGPRSLSRLLKHPPDQIREALIRLDRRNLIALAGRFIQVVDLDQTVPGSADPSPAVPVVDAATSLCASTPDASPARDALAGLPHQQREELLRRARERMATFLGAREPSVSALEAVAAGLLREKAK